MMCDVGSSRIRIPPNGGCVDLSEVWKVMGGSFFKGRRACETRDPFDNK